MGNNGLAAFGLEPVEGAERGFGSEGDLATIRNLGAVWDLIYAGDLGDNMRAVVDRRPVGHNGAEWGFGCVRDTGYTEQGVQPTWRTRNLEFVAAEWFGGLSGSMNCWVAVEVLGIRRLQRIGKFSEILLGNGIHCVPLSTHSICHGACPEHGGSIQPFWKLHHTETRHHFG